MALSPETVRSPAFPAAEGVAATQPAPAQVDPAALFSSLVLVVATALLFFPWPGPPAAWQASFAAYFISIVLQSVPYILLGALVAGVMEQVLPSGILARFASRLGPVGLPAVALLSPLFPSCECGVVSVGRGLLRKGLPLPHTLTYLLAAPILNPTVLFTTYLAFQDWRYPLARAAGGFFVAVAVGLVFLRRDPRQVFQPAFLVQLGLQSPEPAQLPSEAALEFKRPSAPRRLAEALSAPNPELSPTDSLVGNLKPIAVFSSRLRQLCVHVRGEFLEMTGFFLLGVLIASAMKTFIDPLLLARLGGGLISGPAVMMGTAFVLSLCAEADAFPAASFSEFRFPALLAFLVLGPMLDIKLLLMYRSVFRPRFIAIFAGAIVAGVTLYVAWLSLIGGLRW
jgi:uncharacterized membrane protein YraQ (UPF0718 family)